MPSFVEINDIPFRIEDKSDSPISRLIPSPDRKSVIERPLTDKEFNWYWDRAEDNACVITEERARDLALKLS